MQRPGCGCRAGASGARTQRSRRSQSPRGRRRSGRSPAASARARTAPPGGEPGASAAGPRSCPAGCRRRPGPALRRVRFSAPRVSDRNQRGRCRSIPSFSFRRSIIGRTSDGKVAIDQAYSHDASRLAGRHPMSVGPRLSLRALSSGKSASEAGFRESESRDLNPATARLPDANTRRPSREPFPSP